MTGCDASVVISVVSFLNRINGVGFRDHEESDSDHNSGFVLVQ